MTGKLNITCSAWRALHKNTLQGFATVRVAEMRLTIHDVAVHEKNGKRWAQLPSKPWVQDGAVVTNDDGKVIYSPILEFDGRDVSDAFSRAVIDAVQRYKPEALDAR